jgi:hypothetical protein
MSSPARQRPKPPVPGSRWFAGFVFFAIVIANGNCNRDRVFVCPGLVVDPSRRADVDDLSYDPKAARADGHVRIEDNHRDPALARLEAIEAAEAAGRMGSSESDRLRDRPCVNAVNASACLDAEMHRFIALTEQGMEARDAFLSITAAQLGDAARRR